jgi:hypothetical protein
MKKIFLSFAVVVALLTMTFGLVACGSNNNNNTQPPQEPIKVTKGTYLVDIDNSYRQPNGGSQQSIRQFENIASNNVYNYRYSMRIECDWFNTSQKNWFMLMGVNWGGMKEQWFEADINTDGTVELTPSILSNIGNALAGATDLTVKYLNGRIIMECHSSANVFMHFEFGV